MIRRWIWSRWLKSVNGHLTGRFFTHTARVNYKYPNARPVLVKTRIEFATIKRLNLTHNNKHIRFYGFHCPTAIEFNTVKLNNCIITFGMLSYPNDPTVTKYWVGGKNGVNCSCHVLLWTTFNVCSKCVKQFKEIGVLVTGCLVRGKCGGKWSWHW